MVQQGGEPHFLILLCSLAHPLQVVVTRLGEAQAPGGAVHQPAAEFGLQRRHRPACHRLADAGFGMHDLPVQVGEGDGIVVGDAERADARCGYGEGTTGRNVARLAVVRAGLPISIAGTTVRLIQPPKQACNP